MGITSLILGLFAFFTFTYTGLAFLLATVSIALGIASIITKKYKGLGITGIVLSVLAFGLMISLDINSTDNTTSNNASNNTSIVQNEKDKLQIIYDKNNIIIKITDYKYSETWDKIEFTMYIENNSTQDLCFNIDGSVSINDFTVEGGYFYKEVNSNTKSNYDFTIRNLKNNNIKEEKLKDMKFKLDIYHSENFIIKERIEDNLEIIYNF